MVVVKINKKVGFRPLVEIWRPTFCLSVCSHGLGISRTVVASKLQVEIVSNRHELNRVIAMLVSPAEIANANL